MASPENTTIYIPLDGESLNNDDAAWALLCAFLIFTMQTGFAMLESGFVSPKNSANIMVKNAVDVLIGGTAYWIFGYAFSFGTHKGANGFIGHGDFFFRALNDPKETFGSRSAHYFFQLSFATTSTTIVSGAIAERMKLKSYMIFAFINVFIYSVPASWAWSSQGWLNKLGFFDYAGTAVVHMSGGMSAFAAVWILGPRKDRFTHPERYGMSSPITALIGTFMLWWAWLGFNAGSTFVISDGWWRIGTSASITTLNGSIGGGYVGLLYSLVIHRGKILVDVLITSILGGLVAITGIASVISTWESFIVGFIGGVVALAATKLIEKMRIDDVVGAVPVHGVTGMWGALAIGLFGRGNSKGQLEPHLGLFHGGGFYLLGVQLLAVICIASWSLVLTSVVCLIMRFTIGMRVDAEEEELGADLVEHGIKSNTIAGRLDAALRRELDHDQQIDQVVDLLVKQLVGARPKTGAKNLHKVHVMESSLSDESNQTNQVNQEHWQDFELEKGSVKSRRASTESRMRFERKF